MYKVQDKIAMIYRNEKNPLFHIVWITSALYSSSYKKDDMYENSTGNINGL